MYDCGVLVASIPGADIILYETANSKQDVNKNVTVYYQSSVTVKKVDGWGQEKSSTSSSRTDEENITLPEAGNIKMINVVKWASYQLGPVL